MFCVNIMIPLGLFWVSALVSAKSLTKDDERIVGGEPASITELPHQVHIGGCGGSIINKRHILTAAHCFGRNPNPSEVKVLIGSDNLDSGGERYQAVRYVLNPDYDDFTHESDVAIIKLEKSIQFSNKARPIKLADPGYEVPDGTDLTVSGWGATEPRPGDKRTVELRKVIVPKVSDADCKNAYFPRNITSTMFCAGETGKDSCQGDSGGPIIQKTSSGNILVGIVSFGCGCGQPKYPGVYAKVSALRKWIDENSKL